MAWISCRNWRRFPHVQTVLTFACSGHAVHPSLRGMLFLRNFSGGRIDRPPRPCMHALHHGHNLHALQG